MTRWWWCAVLLCGATVARAAPVERFAVVVGNNVAPVEALQQLHYADDDAARLYEFLTAAGHRARLLTVLDPESQGLFAGLVTHAVPPTRALLLEVLAQVQAEMQAAHARGSTVEFVFAFAGHGQGGPEGGAIYLLDGPFTRADLATQVVAASPADFNHILIDACDSYFMVAARGGYQDDRVASPNTMDLVKNYLGGDGPTQDVRTGWLVSTNQAAQTHEYQGFGAGVFSHVVHSALTGAADANRDGVVEYSEVLAYAAAAAQEISDPRARLNVHGRPPPRDVHHPLMDLRAGRFAHFLRLGPEVTGRLHVEDDRNVRYVDLNKAPGTDMVLALADARVYRVVREADGREARVNLKVLRRGAVTLGDFAAPAAAARGTVPEIRRELFAVPFDTGFYRGFVASQQLTPARAGPTFNPPEAGRQAWLPQRPRLVFGIPGLVLLGGGGLLGVGAGLATLLTKLAYDTYVVSLRETGLADPTQERRINALRVVTGMLVAGGIAAVALGGVLVAVELLWPVRRTEDAP